MLDNKDAIAIEEQCKNSDAELAKLEEQVAAKKQENKIINKQRNESISKFREDLISYSERFMGEVLNVDGGRELGELSTIFVKRVEKWKSSRSDNNVVHKYYPAFYFRYKDGSPNNDTGLWDQYKPISYVVKGDPNYEALVKAIIGEEGKVIEVSGYCDENLFVYVFCYFYRQNNDMKQSIDEMMKIFAGRTELNSGTIINDVLYGLYLTQ